MQSLLRFCAIALVALVFTQPATAAGKCVLMVVCVEGKNLPIDKQIDKQIAAGRKLFDAAIDWAAAGIGSNNGCTINHQ
ncbi:hypothetical protein [Ralstonia sp. SET104]|uniref:hypothetical protein n=1 Tax=Ralstonia sp. SET104 TaxID=2448774 RepID=UPI000F55AB68|nr:hypothetical protein [Ralstonia sp. SET104]GCB03761.1 hypothetical protein PSUB009319_13920 [Ralstonia sp. SET104]